MKFHSQAIVVIMMLAVLSCSKHAPPTTPTPERNYFVEIKTNQNNEFNNKLVAFLKDKIPQKKYAITNSSGVAWPFYASLNADETIAVDSLMPPHWFIHKMILKEPNSVLQGDDHLVKIELMVKPDTLLNYRVEVYEMNSTQLSLTATSGIHFMDSTKFSSAGLLDHYLKSILRYSFK